MDTKTEQLERTPEGILARMNEVAKRDRFGIERSRLLESLPFAQAKQFLNTDAPHTPEEWEKRRPRTYAALVREVVGYLPMAWVKANARRSASVLKSLAHFAGLYWLMGQAGKDQLAELEEAGFLECKWFGKPLLVKVSESVGFPWREHDDDQWVEEADDEPLTAAQVLGQ